MLRQRLDQLPEQTQADARGILACESRLLARFDAIVAEPIAARRTRCHGDYHLGQVLRADDDFIIVDFEGEPARSLAERRAKRSPLVDVAGMLRSFHYAASQALFRRLTAAGDDPARKRALRGAADAWYRWVSAGLLDAYAEVATPGDFLPRSAAHCDRLLELFMLDKAVYELAYELNNRPDWVEVPLAGLAMLLATG